MRRFGSPLDNIKIASPCSMNWDEMFGDNRKRFCGECKLNVYNLSDMSESEAENRKISWSKPKAGCALNITGVLMEPF